MKEPTNYIEKAQEPEKSMVAGEPIVAGWVTDTMVEENPKKAFMRDFVHENYAPDRQEELQARNFLVGEPFVYDVLATESDWARMEKESEESGIASSDEVQKVFDRWLCSCCSGFFFSFPPIFYTFLHFFYTFLA